MSYNDIMNISKANLSVSGESLTLGMDIVKVDKANRLVMGFATLDNVDEHDDIILAEASVEAFSNFRKNIREMHQPIAVGKMVDFKEDTFYDTSSARFYNGIWVKVYVSKGAEDTWQKVLDGTLSGFSIGGEIEEADTVPLQQPDGMVKSVRIIKRYSLNELSLVDNPANQLANVFSIVKSEDGGKVLKGIIAEVATETVFWCERDEMAKTSSDEGAKCASCGDDMANIGWFEYDGGDKAEKVQSIIDTHLNKQDSPATDEGGVEVADTVAVEETAEVETEAATDEVVETAEVADDAAAEETTAIEKAADVSEVDDAGDDDDAVAQAVAEATSKLEKSIEESVKAAANRVQEVVDSLAASVTELVSKHGELVTKHDDLAARFEALNSDVTKRLETVEGTGAVKKSGDLGGEPEKTLEKSKDKGAWNGAFLDGDSL